MSFKIIDFRLHRDAFNDLDWIPSLLKKDREISWEKPQKSQEIWQKILELVTEILKIFRQLPLLISRTGGFKLYRNQPCRKIEFIKNPFHLRTDGKRYWKKGKKVILALCFKNSCDNFGVKATIIDDRNLQCIKLIHNKLRSLRSIDSRGLSR